MKTRLQAAKQVLSMAELKDSMKGKQEPSEGVITIKKLAETFDDVRKKLGYKDPGKE